MGGAGLCGSIRIIFGADITAAASYATELKELIREGGYDPKQVFNFGETALFWKRLPTRTYMSKTEKSAPGFKASRIDLLFFWVIMQMLV